MTMIKGVVIPTDWDEQGNVTGIAISSHDENEYVVYQGGKGAELLHFIRKEVEVGGIISEEENRKVIKVRKYSIPERPQTQDIPPS